MNKHVGNTQTRLQLHHLEKGAAFHFTASSLRQSVTQASGVGLIDRPAGAGSHLIYSDRHVSHTAQRPACSD